MKSDGIASHLSQTGLTEEWVATTAHRNSHYAQAVRRVMEGGGVSAREAWKLLQAMAPVPCHAPLVRLGSRFDGGYLVPLDFLGITTALAAGNETNKEFEDDLAEGLGLQVHLCDRSSSEDAFSTAWNAEQQSLCKAWLGEDPFPDFLSINDWIRESAPSGNFLLKMDIEGYEYSNLLALEDVFLKRVRILVVEFHFLHRLGYPNFFFLAFQPVMERLLSSFDVVHLHPNNYEPLVKLCENFFVPRVLEATFLRKEPSVTTRPKARTPVILPHPLDQSNASTHHPLFLGPPFLRHADRKRSEEEQKAALRRWRNLSKGRQGIVGQKP